jgi:nucleoside phosphorylase
VVVIPGMGEARAAGAVAFILEHYQPRVFICLGFGGGVTTALPAGALVLGETCWGYEPETGALRDLAAPPAPVFLEEVQKQLQAHGLPAFRGCVVTTPGITHKASQATRLAHLTHPVLDLETAAVAAAVGPRGLPFLTLRAVTDTGGEEIPGFIQTAAATGREPSPGAALAWVAADPRRLATLVRLWRRSRLAAANLAQALAVVLEML